MSISRLQQIKCHDLDRLLLFSGERALIQNRFREDWDHVVQWKPDWRYSANVIRKDAALNFLKRCQLITQNI